MTTVQPASADHSRKRRLVTRSGRLASIAIGAIMATVLVAVPASAHTVTWNPATYTTPITNPCRAVNTWYGQGSHTWASGQYYAIDIAVATGTPIYAPKAGYAWYQWNTGGGNMINVRHTESGGSLTSVLAHLSSVRIRTDGVTQWVNKNQLIGYSGSSGQVTGPHLHWQMNVSDHMSDSNYGAILNGIPGVMDNWSPKKICGTQGGV